jgi:hypothetical protein
MATTEPAETELPQIVNLSQVRVETVQAGLVRASQSAIQQLNADEVDIQTSFVGAVQTEEFHAKDSILGTAVIHQGTLQDSIVGGLRAETLSFNGAAAVALANTMANKEIQAIAVIGTNVQADSIRTGLLISREVHGNVTTTVDSRTALLAGLAGGALAGLIMLLGSLLFGRKK